MNPGWQILWTALATAGINLLFAAYFGSKVKGSVDDAFAREKETREALLGNRVYVTQAQFDIQLSAIKELLEAISGMYISLESVAPSVQIRPDNFSKTQIREDYANRIIKLDNDWMVLRAKTDALRAFIPEELYRILSDASRLIWEGSIMLKAASDSELESSMYRVCEPFKEKVADLFEKATSFAREHLASLSVRE